MAPFSGSATLPSADAVGLGAAEDELSERDVDLAAAEGDGVDAVLDRGEDLLGRVLTAEHHRVGHARHRRVGKGLAAAVARRLHAHQPGVLPVLHVADEPAVLDQHGAVGRRALVVDGQRAAALGDRAVVDDGDALGRHLLSHQAGEGRGLLAVEVALEPVADGLVQHDARPAGAEHDVEGAGRRGDGAKVGARLRQRLVGDRLPGLGDHEVAEAGAPAGAEGATLLALALAADDGDVDAHQRPDVAHQPPVGPQDLDRLPLRPEGRGDLPHVLALAADIGVDLLQQLHLRLEARRGDRVFVAVELAVGAGGRLGDDAAVAGLDRRDGGRGTLQRPGREFAGMGEADRLAGDGPQAEALVGGEVAGAQAAVVEDQRFLFAGLQIEFAIVGAVQRLAEDRVDLGA